jgi:hypothetical protein
MSLTSQIKDPASPVAGWMRAHLDQAAVAGLVAECNDRLASCRIVSAEGTDVRLVGRAFDYAFRWCFPDFAPGVAMLGAAYCTGMEWRHAPAVVRALVRAGEHSPNPAVRWRACCVFSWFEEIVRTATVPAPLERCWGQPATKETIAALLRAVPTPSVEDLTALIGFIAEDWGDELMAEPRHLNPTFAGSADVGGADADWLLGATLWDGKVSRQRRPFRAEYIEQAIGYVLLNYDDAHRIEAIGWYFPRQRLRLRYSLADVLTNLCGIAGETKQARAQLRQSFREAVRRQA